VNCNTRALILLTLPGLIGLVTVLISISGVTPTLEPDDIRYFAQYRELLSSPLRNWKLAFVITNSWQDHWWVDPGYVRYFRPLPILTYFLDQFFFGESARALLVTNIFCYFALCLSVSGLLQALTNNQRARLLAGIWFATLPVHSEGVSYIAGRTDVLAWIFGTLFLRAQLLQHTTLRKAIYFLGALACKEYMLFLPLVGYFFGNKEMPLRMRWRGGEWLTYTMLGMGYLLVWYFLLEGGSLHGKALPLYFPVQTITQAFYHLGLQTLSFISLSILGFPAPMYSTTITNYIIVTALVSLPLFLGILFTSSRHLHFTPTLIFFLVALVTTAPLYVSLRYYIGPSVAFACCIACAIERLSSKRALTISSVVALPLLIVHILILSFDLKLQFDSKAREVVSSAEVSEALRNVQDKIKTCKVVLILNAPYGQVFHMFLPDFFKTSGDNLEIKAVILSVKKRAAKGLANPVGYHQSEEGTLVISGEDALVDYQNADMPLPLTGQSIERTIHNVIKVSTDVSWKHLKVTLPPTVVGQYCLAEFNYEKGVGIKVHSIAQ
jgi:hypothetical protein